MDVRILPETFVGRLGGPGPANSGRFSPAQGHRDSGWATCFSDAERGGPCDSLEHEERFLVSVRHDYDCLLYFVPGEPYPAKDQVVLLGWRTAMPNPVEWSMGKGASGAGDGRNLASYGYPAARLGHQLDQRSGGHS